MQSILRIATPAEAWGSSTGKGVRVAVVDSGIDASHPAVAGCVKGGADVVDRGSGPEILPCSFEDSFGHGTACAGIILGVAPEAELYSVKVLGAQLTGSGATFLAGLQWAIESHMDVINLSLGTTKQQFFAPLHELVDQAYYKGCILVSAANNVPPPSFPSIYSSLIAVGNLPLDEKLRFVYHPGQRIEIGARGTNVHAPWSDHSYRNLTGTSFAAPHVSGICSLILSKHPGLRPHELKALLYGLAEEES